MCETLTFGLVDLVGGFFFPLPSCDFLRTRWALRLVIPKLLFGILIQRETLWGFTFTEGSNNVRGKMRGLYLTFYGMLSVGLEVGRWGRGYLVGMYEGGSLASRGVCRHM